MMLLRQPNAVIAGLHEQFRTLGRGLVIRADQIQDSFNPADPRMMLSGFISVLCSGKALRGKATPEAFIMKRKPSYLDGLMIRVVVQAIIELIREILESH